MNFREALDKLDKATADTGFPEYRKIAAMFSVHNECRDYDLFESRLKKYWVSSWMCTDTIVGLAAYYLDNQLVAVSAQPARKSDENIFFISQPAADLVEKFVSDLEEKSAFITIADLETPLDDFWFPAQEEPYDADV